MPLLRTDLPGRSVRSQGHSYAWRRRPTATSSQTTVKSAAADASVASDSTAPPMIMCGTTLAGLLEETWLRLVTKAGDLTDDTRLGPWLFTVARNLFASWCRHRALDDERMFDLALAWPGALPRESPFEAAARSETERRLEAALARLPPRDREVLLLVGADLSPSEAAVALGLAPEVVRKRLQRARERLARELHEGSSLREMVG